MNYSFKLGYSILPVVAAGVVVGSRGAEMERVLVKQVRCGLPKQGL